MRIIYSTNGHRIVVDSADFAVLSKFNWCVVNQNGKLYVHSNGVGGGSMHRYLMEAGKGQEVDHVDGNGLNNRRKNLRFATHQQNCLNRVKRVIKVGSKSFSRYKGVKRQRDIFSVYASVNGVETFFGSFKNETDAANVYDFYAVKYHGEFAKLNFPKTSMRVREESLRRKYVKKYKFGFRGIGVHFTSAGTARYAAHLYDSGRRVWSYGFSTPEAAAREYDKLAKKFHGAKAKLNFA